MATKIITALVDGSVQQIEVEATTSEEQITIEDRLVELEDKPIITDGNLLVGNGTDELEEMTPEETLIHINGTSVATMTSAEYENLEELNSNTLYIITDINTDADGDFMNLSSDQSASGVKTFNSGIKFGENKVFMYYDETISALRITFNQTSQEQNL